MPTTIKITLTLELSDIDTGKNLTHAQARKAYDDAAHAIQNRLFGDGFLSDDISADGWSVTHTSTVES